MYKSSAKFYLKHKRLTRAGDMTPRGSRRIRKSGKSHEKRGGDQRADGSSILLARTNAGTEPSDPGNQHQSKTQTQNPLRTANRILQIASANTFFVRKKNLGFKRNLVICDTCGARIRGDRIVQHRIKGHGSPDQTGKEVSKPAIMSSGNPAVIGQLPPEQYHKDSAKMKLSEIKAEIEHLKVENQRLRERANPASLSRIMATNSSPLIGSPTKTGGRLVTCPECGRIMSSNLLENHRKAEHLTPNHARSQAQPSTKDDRYRQEQFEKTMLPGGLCNPR
jgi:hypothetical protein